MADPAVINKLLDEEASGGINPYCIMDGPWGGFRPARWLTAGEYGFAPGDVVEREETGLREAGFRWRWTRLWVHAEKRWRLLTTSEVCAMPRADGAA